MKQASSPKGRDSAESTSSGSDLQDALRTIRQHSYPLLTGAGETAAEEGNEIAQPELEAVIAAAKALLSASERQYQERFGEKWPELDGKQRRLLRGGLVDDGVEQNHVQLAMETNPQSALALYLLATSNATVLSTEMPSPKTYLPQVLFAVADVGNIESRNLHPEEYSFPDPIRQLIGEGPQVSWTCEIQRATELAGQYGCRLATKAEYLALLKAKKVEPIQAFGYLLQEGDTFYDARAENDIMKFKDSDGTGMPLFVVTVPKT